MGPLVAGVSNGLSHTSPQLTNYVALVRPRDRRLLAKLVPTLADWGCRVVSVTNPTAVYLFFTDRSRYFNTPPQE
jgi:hypothetical protein